MNTRKHHTGPPPQEHQPAGVEEDRVVEGHLTELAEILVEFWLRRQRRQGRRGTQTASTKSQDQSEIAAND